MDFVADRLADGRRFRALRVIDLFTRECLAIDVGHGLSGRDVVTTLERLRFERGLPQRIYCDNGSEFVSAAMDCPSACREATRRMRASSEHRPDKGLV